MHKMAFVEAIPDADVDRLLTGKRVGVRRAAIPQPLSALSS